MVCPFGGVRASVVRTKILTSSCIMEKIHDEDDDCVGDDDGDAGLFEKRCRQVDRPKGTETWNPTISLSTKSTL